LGKNKDLKYIYTEEKKKEILKSIGLKNLIVIPFTRELSEISAYTFIKDILHKKLNAKHIILGFNHFFGKNREGSFEQLKVNGPKYGFDVEEISDGKNKIYKITVKYAGEIKGIAAHTSKKKAEQMAAQKTFELMGLSMDK
jgi:FAD synthase